MQVVAKAPVTASTLTWRRSSGQPVLTVVAKTTYRLMPGECRLVDDDPEPVATQNQFVGGDPTQELAVASDLVPHKSRADVVLVGSAYAPGGSATSVMVRFAVGSFEKSVEVFGERMIMQDGSLRPGAKLTRTSLSYERAAGGPDTWNPVGVRSDVTDQLGRRLLPSLQPPGLFVSDGSTEIPPIGVGPLSPRWPSRQMLWTVGGEPSAARLRDEPIVDRLEKSFFNIAPADQRIDEIRPRERILLENLSPDHAVIATALPDVRAVASLRGRDLQMIGDTLWIDTDRQICTVTWRVSLDVSDADRDAKVIVRLAGDLDRGMAEISDESTSDQAPDTARNEARVHRPKANTLPFRVADNGIFPRSAERPGPSQVSQPPWFAGAAAASRSDHPPSSSGTQPAIPVAGGSVPPTFGPPPAARAQPSVPPSGPGFAAPARPPAPAMVGQASTMAAPIAMSAPAVAPPPLQPSSPLAVGYPAVAKPVEVAPQPLGHAAVVGTEAASNAAARAEARSIPSEDSSAVRAMGAPSTEPIDLLWFDPRSVRRVRVYYKSLLADLSFDDVDERHEIPSDDPDLDKAREEMFGVLTREPVADPALASRLMSEAIDERGRFTPPLAVFESDFRVAFSDAARLRAAVATLSPLGPNDKRLKDLCDAANEQLGRPHPNAGGSASRLLASLREHYSAQYAKSPQALALDAEVDRQLLEERVFDERTLFGGKHLRCMFGGGASLVPAYVAEGVRDSLPLFDVFRARLLAEVHLRQDKGEPSSLSLRVVALARLLSL